MKYKLKSDSKVHLPAVAGTIVYKSNDYDYGLARDDTLFTGVEHISVKLDLTEAYSFTHPLHDLEIIED